MRAQPALLLTLSLGLNLCLVGAYFIGSRNQPEQASEIINSQLVSSNHAPNKIRTHVVVRKQFFSWSEIESDDYPSYIANLKAIGCPEATIRDIITADINQLYLQKQEKDVPIGGPQWWRAYPDAVAVQDAIARQSQLEAERRELLSRLLGPNRESARENPISLSSPAENDLEGPVLSVLPAVLKQAIREIATEASNRRKVLFEEQQKLGKPVDPDSLIQLEKEARNELARVLTPVQLDDYLLRYSPVANLIRQDTAALEANPEEFRKIYQIRADLDPQIEALSLSTDAASVKKRAELLKQREDAIQQSLGAERYRLYQLAQEPAYQDAMLLGRQLGASPKAILSLYEINQLTLQEQQRIKNDSSLDKEQREHALLQLQLEREKSTRELLDNKTGGTAADEEDAMPPVPQAP